MLGTYGTIHVVAHDGRYTASIRYRDLDGRLRRVRATATAKSHAAALLRQRLLHRPSFGGPGSLDRSSPFSALAEAWLTDLALRDLASNTKDNYREDLARYVQPVFEHFTLGEITTGRVEWFLQREAAVSYSRAKHSRTMLNLLFGFALRQDAIPRNPGAGCSPLKKPKGAPQALTLEQIAAIRAAAAAWRAGPGFKGPKPDGQVRDLIEVLLGTGLRPGEALALRHCDVTEGAGQTAQLIPRVRRPPPRSAPVMARLRGAEHSYLCGAHVASPEGTWCSMCHALRIGCLERPTPRVSLRCRQVGGTVKSPCGFRRQAGSKSPAESAASDAGGRG